MKLEGGGGAVEAAGAGGFTRGALTPEGPGWGGTPAAPASDGLGPGELGPEAPELGNVGIGEWADKEAAF